MPMRYRPTEAPDLPVEQLAPFLNEARQDVAYYIAQIWAGWQIKGAVSAVIAACSTFYTGCFFGNWALFCIWVLFMTVDLGLGAALAIKKGQFTMVRFRKFITKAGTHVAIIALFGFLNHSFSSTAGTALPITDWFLCMLLCSEALSILSNMDKLGLPVPPVARRVIAIMHRKAHSAMEECLTVGNSQEAQGEGRHDEQD